MNFSIKFFGAALLIVSHQTVAMNNGETKPPLFDLSKSCCQAQSSDGMWRMQAFGAREFLYRKNSAGNFEILGEMARSKTKTLVSIGSNVSSKDRFLLRITDNNRVDVIDTLRNKTRGLAKDDADLLHPISDELVAAHMSINSETIAVFDAQDKTILVANPLENK
jgi:hypothetical protein